MGEMVSIPLDEYNRLLAAAADLEDLRVFDRVTADLADGHEETIPARFVARIIEGENPLRVWRDYRGFTQIALAEAAGVHRVQIADIEAGRRKGSVETLKKLAAGLGVSMDDLA